MALHFLEFDYSEDNEGTCTWDALASATAERLPELLREITALLAWACAEFGEQRGSLDDGGLWDYDLQCERGDHALQPLAYDPGAHLLRAPPSVQAGERVTLSLSISGTPAFAAPFAERFGLPSP